MPPIPISPVVSKYQPTPGNLLDQIRAEGEARQQAIATIDLQKGDIGGDILRNVLGIDPAQVPNLAYRVAAFLFGAVMVFIAVSRLLQQPVRQATQFAAPASRVVRKVKR